VEEEEEDGGKHRNEAFYVLFHMSSVCAFLLWNAYMCSICRVFKDSQWQKLFYAKGEAMVLSLEQRTVLGG
jgi:hypothetical protein